VEWIHISQDMGNKYCKNDNKVPVSIKCGIDLGQLRKYYDFKRLSSVELRSESVCDQLGS